MRERERQKRERERPMEHTRAPLPLLNIVVSARDVGMMATTLGP